MASKNCKEKKHNVVGVTFGGAEKSCGAVEEETPEVLTLFHVESEPGDCGSR